MQLVRWAGFAVGVFMILGCAVSVGYTLVIPRGVGSRLSVLVGRRMVRSTFIFIADRFDSYETKDRVLAVAGPAALLAIFLVWLVAFLLGYSLLIWPLDHISFAHALREAGSSIFTLGIDASHRSGATVVDYMAAATGLFVVALEIAYLPTIYGAFNRRETLVTLLQSRAGSPAWGPEILARHQLVGIMDNLAAFYADWEQWAADVAESHSNYPVLIHFRSPHPLRSWIVALLAVLDSAALYQAFDPDVAPSEARLCIRMGFVCLRDIADALKIPYEADPMPDAPLQLTWEEFLQGVERLREAGFPLDRTPEEAWPHFRGWRVNYEGLAYGLAHTVHAAPGPWSGDRRRIGTITPVPPVDRRPDDPEGARNPGGRWAGK